MAEMIARLNAGLEGSYRLEREIGVGGMASVYLGEDVKHRRKVAIKVLRPELAATIATDRFLREIEIVASLSHPHILMLIDSGDAAGLLYYVVPYVEGGSLRDRLDQANTLPVSEAVRITEQVASALEAAHKEGVIHRDVRPGNVLLESESGRAVLTDFGIAGILETGTESITRLTQAGQIQCLIFRFFTNKIHNFIDSYTA